MAPELALPSVAVQDSGSSGSSAVPYHHLAGCRASWRYLSLPTQAAGAGRAQPTCSAAEVGLHGAGLRAAEGLQVPAQRFQLVLQSWVLRVEEAALLYCLAEVFQNLCHPVRAQHRPGFRDRGMGTPSPELWGKGPLRCRGQQSCLKQGTTALARALKSSVPGFRGEPQHLKVSPRATSTEHLGAHSRTERGVPCTKDMVVCTQALWGYQLLPPALG